MQRKNQLCANSFSSYNKKAPGVCCMCKSNLLYSFFEKTHKFYLEAISRSSKILSCYAEIIYYLDIATEKCCVFKVFESRCRFSDLYTLLRVFLYDLCQSQSHPYPNSPSIYVMHCFFLPLSSAEGNNNDNNSWIYRAHISHRNNDSRRFTTYYYPDGPGQTITNSTSWEAYKECCHWRKTLGIQHSLAVHVWNWLFYHFTTVLKIKVVRKKYLYLNENEYIFVLEMIKEVFAF